MDCLFCKISSKQIPSKIVFESDDILAFHDVNPQAPVHILIIPKEHIATLDDIGDSEHRIIGKLTAAASGIAKDLKLEGYRLVFNCNVLAGQSVFHLHCHLLGGRTMHWPPG